MNTRTTKYSHEKIWSEEIVHAKDSTLAVDLVHVG